MPRSTKGHDIYKLWWIEKTDSNSHLKRRIALVGGFAEFRQGIQHSVQSELRKRGHNPDLRPLLYFSVGDFKTRILAA